MWFHRKLSHLISSHLDSIQILDDLIMRISVYSDFIWIFILNSLLFTIFFSSNSFYYLQFLSSSTLIFFECILFYTAATFVPGESLYHCNDVTTRIYLIEKGSAKVYSPIDMIGNGLSKEEIDKKLGKALIFFIFLTFQSCLNIFPLFNNVIESKRLEMSYNRVNIISVMHYVQVSDLNGNNLFNFLSVKIIWTTLLLRSYHIILYYRIFYNINDEFSVFAKLYFVCDIVCVLPLFPSKIFHLS